MFYNKFYNNFFIVLPIIANNKKRLRYYFKLYNLNDRVRKTNNKKGNSLCSNKIFDFKPQHFFRQFASEEIAQR